MADLGPKPKSFNFWHQTHSHTQPCFFFVYIFLYKARLFTCSSPVLTAQPHAPHYMSGADMLHCGSGRMTFASQRRVRTPRFQAVPLPPPLGLSLLLSQPEESKDSKVPGSPSPPTSGAFSTSRRSYMDIAPGTSHSPLTVKYSSVPSPAFPCFLSHDSGPLIQSGEFNYSDRLTKGTQMQEEKKTQG